MQWSVQRFTETICENCTDWQSVQAAWNYVEISLCALAAVAEHCIKISIQDANENIDHRQQVKNMIKFAVENIPCKSIQAYSKFIKDANIPDYIGKLCEADDAALEVLQKAALDFPAHILQKARIDMVLKNPGDRVFWNTLFVTDNNTCQMLVDLIAPEKEATGFLLCMRALMQERLGNYTVAHATLAEGEKRATSSNEACIMTIHRMLLIWRDPALITQCTDILFQIFQMFQDRHNCDLDEVVYFLYISILAHESAVEDDSAINAVLLSLYHRNVHRQLHVYILVAISALLSTRKGGPNTLHGHLDLLSTMPTKNVEFDSDFLVSVINQFRDRTHFPQRVAWPWTN